MLQCHSMHSTTNYKRESGTDLGTRVQNMAAFLRHVLTNSTSLVKNVSYYKELHSLQGLIY